MHITRPELNVSPQFGAGASYGFPLFEDLEGDELSSALALHAGQRHCERDVQLIGAGDPRAPLLTILRGWAFSYNVLRDGRRQILNVLLPGDTVGVDTVLTGAPGLSVQSAGPVSYCMFDRDRAVALAAEQPWFRSRAVDALVRERAAAQAAMTRLGQCSAEERIASLLLELYGRLYRRGLADGGTFMLELTQQHLADLVGLTAVHLNRVLQRMRARGLIAAAGQRVTLLDVPSLECLAPLRDAHPGSRLLS